MKSLGAIWVQRKLEPLQSWTTTVQGLTMINAPCRPLQFPDSHTQEKLSVRCRGTPRAFAVEHGELLAKGQVLQGDISEVAGETRRRNSEPSSGNLASS